VDEPAAKPPGHTPEDDRLMREVLLECGCYEPDRRSVGFTGWRPPAEDEPGRP
jgi:hypothetical protein